MEQVTVTGINVHGTRTSDIVVSCPRDREGDGVLDEGGCADVRSQSSGTNFMSLYELDPLGNDELVQTLYFPELSLTLECNPLWCKPAGSRWVTPISYDSPASPPKVFAEMTMVVNSGTFINTRSACSIPELRASIVSAASFKSAVVAPDSIASAFGQALGQGTASASTLPLPTTLAGATVTVTDRNGTARAAQLFYVSPEQVNFLVAAGTAPGSALISIRRTDGITARATVEVKPVAPALFTANASGAGVAAAFAVRVARDGTQMVEPVYECAATCTALPLTLSVPPEQLILVLFGTGIRNHADAGGARATIGGRPATILYAGAQSQYAGLDQVNVQMPALSTRGQVSVVLSVGDTVANTVSVTVR